MRQLGALLRLRARGVRLDSYLMDAFWYAPDGAYRAWRKPHWPQGPGRWLEGCLEEGIKPGLWFSSNTLCKLKAAPQWRDSSMPMAGACACSTAASCPISWRFCGIGTTVECASSKLISQLQCRAVSRPRQAAALGNPCPQCGCAAEWSERAAARASRCGAAGLYRLRRRPPSRQPICRSARPLITAGWRPSTRYSAAIRARPTCRP